MNTDVHCNPVKNEPREEYDTVTQSHRHLQNHHRNYHQDVRPSSDWSDVGEFEYVYDKIKQQHEHSTSSALLSTDNIVCPQNYPVCTSTNSLDTSSGLNGAYSALDINNSNGRTLAQPHDHQQQSSSLQTCVENDDHSKLHARQAHHQSDYLSSSSSQSVSPVVMQDQERIKLERKRLRNRLAASLCRKRKLEKISTLESTVQLAKDENFKLVSSISKCQEELAELKRELKQHANYGCKIPQSFEIFS